MRALSRPRPHAARRLRTALIAGVVLGAVPMLGVPAASAAPTAPGASWATTVTGQRVPVSPTHYPTPIHPEQVTHPDADSMGSTIAAHDPTAARTSGLSPRASAPQLPGIDISSHQGNVNWGSVAPYIDFVYIKASEGSYYTNPYFAQQYNGSYNYGVILGAYHFGIPNNSSGTAQADYFIGHGGAWSADGKTLPGALDIKYNPYGAECFGLSQSSMVNWIWNFVTEYASREHAYPRSTRRPTGGPPAPATTPDSPRTTRCGSPTTAPAAAVRSRRAGVTTRSGSTRVPARRPVTRTCSTAPIRDSRRWPRTADYNCTPVGGVKARSPSTPPTGPLRRTPASEADRFAQQQHGLAGLVIEQDGHVSTVSSFEIAGARIRRIWAMRNPEKLRPWMAD